MADVAHSAATLNALTKEVYAKEDISLIVESSTVVADSIKFVQKEMRNGNLYHQPVWLTREHGYTLKEGATLDAHQLNDAIAATSKDAQVRGAEFTLRSVISYGMIATLLSGEGEARKRAFKAGITAVRENQIKTSKHILEIELLYGGGSAAAAAGSEGIGLVSQRTTDSGTTQVFRISTASWAPAIWSGAVGMYVDVYDTTLATLRNAGTMRVTAVDMANKDITFLGTEAQMDTIVATDRIFLRSAKTHEMSGLVKVGKNTGSLNNIDASVYPEWRASEVAITGKATFEKVMRTMIRSAEFGAVGTVKFLCSNGAWIDMMTDLSALRRFSEKAGGKLEQGGSSLQFYGPNGMKIIFEPTPYMKEGYMIGINPEKCRRVGATDDTARINGRSDSDIFFDLPSYNGVELRRYWNQGFFTPEPTSLVLVTGVTNTVL